MQVVIPSASREAVPLGAALTLFLKGSGSTIARPGRVSTSGNGPVEYGVAGPGGPYAPVYSWGLDYRSEQKQSTQRIRMLSP